VTRRAAVEADSNEDPNDQDLGDREKQDMEKASKSCGMGPHAKHRHDCSKDEDAGDHGVRCFLALNYWFVLQTLPDLFH